jgi:hypothetical protein
MTPDCWQHPPEDIHMIRNHVDAYAAAVCSLTTASAFLLQAVLLDATGLTDTDIWMWLRGRR